MKKLSLLLVSVLCALTLSAQPFGGRQIASPVVNPDNTVTFSLRAPNATEVLVDVQFAGRNKMAKDADGIWSITLGPAPADIYPYCFIVDGVNVMDPLNPDWFPNEKFKNSLLDMRGKAYSANAPKDQAYWQSMQNVPHGKTDFILFPSKAAGLDFPAVVYLPPSYGQSDRKYPVFVLISGTTDTEEVYYKVGRVNFILDNLIAEGKAQEMIVVMPYGNPTLWMQNHGVAPSRDFNLMNKQVADELLPYIDSHYKTLTGAEDRAIGGFSRGGNQALSIGLTNPDKFAWLCSYSSFTSMERPGVYDNAAALNERIRLFWLGVGTDDFLYGNAKEYNDFLTQKGINHVEYYTTDKWGHTWMNARHFLVKTLPLLFQSREYVAANAKTMKVPKAAQKKKNAQKDEQRLTPDVMKRIFPKGVVSPEYNADGTVTFRFDAANAKNVELDCQMLAARAPMSKNADGVWEVTVTPPTNDIYPYTFIMDGLQVADPNCVEIFPNEGVKSSLAYNRTPEPVMQDLQAVPHGKVSYCWYQSSQLGFPRPMTVYTPAGYDPASDKKYPVLYLIHGMTDTYETWYKVGKINLILDNMIARGVAEEMIVVMPYANPAIEMTARNLGPYNLLDPGVNTREIIEEVIPYVEANWAVKTDADSRAIAGFSLGGRQSLATGLGNPDKFHWVSAFAPAIFGDEPTSNFENGLWKTEEVLNKELRFLCLCCGNSDFLNKASRDLDQSLLDRKIEHITFYCPGGHTWMNCRDYFELVARRIFK